MQKLLFALPEQVRKEVVSKLFLYFIFGTASM